VVRQIVLRDFFVEDAKALGSESYRACRESQVKSLAGRGNSNRRPLPAEKYARFFTLHSVCETRAM